MDAAAHRTALYLDGRWRPPAGDGETVVENPATERPIGRVPAAAPADVDAAVAAARAAFGAWAATAPAKRAAARHRLHRCLTDRADAIARTVALELGTPLKVARRVQVGLPLTVLESYARPPPPPPPP